MVSYTLIKGSQFRDDRGKLSFFNDFDLSKVRRLYEIAPSNTDIIRGWQAHKKEKKWFYCNSGSFVLNLIAIDDFQSPPRHQIPCRIELSQANPTILEVPGGYATAIKATEEASKLLVFSDFTLEESKKDDFRFPLEKWPGEW